MFELWDDEEDDLDTEYMDFEDDSDLFDDDEE